jgi:hypothetical protein
MITFIKRFYGIVNLDECIPDDPPRTSKSPLRDEQGTTSYATEEVRVDGQRNKAVKFCKTRKSRVGLIGLISSRANPNP